MHWRIQALLVGSAAAVLSTIGCGGGGGSSRPPIANAGTGILDFRFAVPGRSGSARRRAPRYVSPSTQAISVTVSPENGSTGAAQVFPCTSVCAGQVAAPPGVDGVVFTLLDAVTNGKSLATGSTVALIKAGETNHISATLDGIVDHISMSLAPANIPASTPSTAFLIVNAFDPDGNLITFNGVWVDANGNTVAVDVQGPPGVQLFAGTPNGVVTISAPGAVVQINASLHAGSYAVTPTLRSGSPAVSTIAPTSLLVQPALAPGAFAPAGQIANRVAGFYEDSGAQTGASTITLSDASVYAGQRVFTTGSALSPMDIGGNAVAPALISATPNPNVVVAAGNVWTQIQMPSDPQSPRGNAYVPSLHGWAPIVGPACNAGGLAPIALSPPAVYPTDLSTVTVARATACGDATGAVVLSQQGINRSVLVDRGGDLPQHLVFVTGAAASAFCYRNAVVCFVEIAGDGTVSPLTIRTNDLISFGANSVSTGVTNFVAVDPGSAVGASSDGKVSSILQVGSSITTTQIAQSSLRNVQAVCKTGPTIVVVGSSPVDGSSQLGVIVNGTETVGPVTLAGQGTLDFAGGTNCSLLYEGTALRMDRVLL